MGDVGAGSSMLGGVWRRGLLAAVAACLLIAAPAKAATQHGFITTRDGTQLRYSLDLPDGKGPFPVIMNYEGYAAGSSPGDNGVAVFEPELLKRGYAVMGVQVRGTGCSEGNFDLFGPKLGQDGYDAVEWAAKQKWANGRVGMLGFSFGGIMQLSTAATRPPHLVAIVPSSATSDYYRDVLYPGGILEYDFPYIWTGLQKSEYLPSVPNDPDPACAAKYVAHEPKNISDYGIPFLIGGHAYDDDFWTLRRPSTGFSRIDVPTFLLNHWQDEQLPARIFESLDTFARPEQTWANFSNGNHGRDYYSKTDQALELDFLDHYVRGVANRFPDGVPHLMLDMETAFTKGNLNNEPAWRIGLPSVHGFAPQVWPLALGAAGTLGEDAKATGADRYAYPRPSADNFNPVPGNLNTGQVVWKGPVDKDGALAFTSGPLARDAVVAGPSSLDLWLASTATDTDVQATITEVRPDGQETYVQRGWLRASARALDAAQSTALRPYHPYTKAAEKPLTAGAPTLLRVPILPFAHAFRSGSRIRVIVDAPTGHTGFWAFRFNTTPATNTVLHDGAHRSRLMLGLLPSETAHAPLPACDSLTNQPCRNNAWTTMSSTPLAVPTAAATPARTKTCSSRLSLMLRLKAPRGQRIVKAKVFVNGKRVTTLTGKRLRTRLNLRGLPRGTVRVRIVGTTNRGRQVTDLRTYRTCAKRK